MNDDMISRQRLLKELKHHKELFSRNRIEFLGLSKNDKARVDEIDNCIATVINMPPAQPEIVRCKDCRWRKDQSGSTAWLPCRAIVTPSDFYCGRAERRTDDGD